MVQAWPSASSILILHPEEHLGNLLISIPAIRALQELFPESRHYLAVDAPYRSIAETVVPPDQVITYPRKDLINARLDRKLLLFAQFIRNIRATKPEWLVDLKNGRVSGVMTMLSGARTRIGSEAAKRPFAYNWKTPASRQRHQLHAYFSVVSDIAKKLGRTVSPRIVPLACPPPPTQEAHQFWTDKGLNGRPLVCIHPGGSKEYKIWSSRGFAEVADWVVANGYQAVLLGTKKERKKVDEIRSCMKLQALDLSGQLSLRELVELFQRATLFVGNDSGPMHLAAITGIPVLALYGPTDVTIWGPLSEKAVVLRGKDRCSDCAKGFCVRNLECMDLITPDMVIKKMHDMLT